MTKLSGEIWGTLALQECLGALEAARQSKASPKVTQPPYKDQDLLQDKERGLEVDSTTGTAGNGPPPLGKRSGNGGGDGGGQNGGRGGRKKKSGPPGDSSSSSSGGASDPNKQSPGNRTQSRQGKKHRKTANSRKPGSPLPVDPPRVSGYN